MRIAIDAMGGDYAPANNVAGLQQALQEFPFVEKFLLVGQVEQVESALTKCHIAGDPRIELVPASQVVEMSDPPTAALRQKKDSSITVGSRLLKEGRADALVSAGHTGATVACTVVQNRMLPGIERPGIAGPFPSATGSYIILDVGANVDCKPIHLAQYAILGEAYSRLVLGIADPSVGVLSVGKEDGKGNDLTRAAIEIISHMPVNNFLGNVEGDDLFSGHVDVVLCDGFVGNIILKVAEDLAKTVAGMLRKNLKKTPVRQAGALLSRRAFRELKEITDHEEYGGASLLGIDANCIIAHGASSPKAIKNAIRVATEMVNQQVNAYIRQRLAHIDWQALLTRSAEEPPTRK